MQEKSASILAVEGNTYASPPQNVSSSSIPLFRNSFHCFSNCCCCLMFDKSVFRQLVSNSTTLLSFRASSRSRLWVAFKLLDGNLILCGGLKFANYFRIMAVKEAGFARNRSDGRGDGKSACHRTSSFFLRVLLRPPMTLAKRRTALTSTS